MRLSRAENHLLLQAVIRPDCLRRSGFYLWNYTECQIDIITEGLNVVGQAPPDGQGRSTVVRVFLLDVVWYSMTVQFGAVPGIGLALDPALDHFV